MIFEIIKKIWLTLVILGFPAIVICAIIDYLIDFYKESLLFKRIYFIIIFLNIIGILYFLGCLIYHVWE